MLERAVRQCRDWEQADLHTNIAVNLSTHTLYDPRFLSTVTDLLQANDVDPSQLTLEITESMLMNQPEQARRVLADLHALGVSIAIDDFGTGYSSLVLLRRLAANTREDFRSDQKVKIEDVLTNEVLAGQARSSANEALYQNVLALAALERVTAGGFPSGLGARK